MQSRTSYFNSAIFLNTLKRFWPVWLGYFGAWMLILPVSLFSRLMYNTEFISVKRQILNAGTQPGVVMALIFGVLAAMAVWSFVYNSRSMSGIACLPVKREGVFFSVAAAGLLPMLAANLVVALLTMLMTAVSGLNMVLPCIQWFAMVSLQLIFFYGFASLCAQLTGNIVTLPVVYLVLNFTAWVVERLVTSLMEVLVYGLGYVGMGISMFLSPVLAMFECSAQNVTEYLPQYDEYRTLDVYYDGWVILVIYALIGLLLLAAALALYRRRRMESVGDVVAVNVLKPVFKYCLCFGCALVAGFVLYVMLLDYMSLHPSAEAAIILVLMLCGAFVGYFAAEMLINKSFRVFRGRWKGFGVSALVLVVLMAGVEFDLFGIEKRVPDIEDVEGVSVSVADHVYYEDSENIEKAIEIHRSIIENKNTYETAGSGYIYAYGRSEYVSFSYILKDGRSLQREYHIYYNAEDEATQEDILALQNLQNTNEAIAYRKALPFEFKEDSIISGSVSSWMTAEQLEELGESTDIESYIFLEYYGYDRDYVEKYMSPAEREMLLEEFYAYNDIESIHMDMMHEFDFTAEELYELYTQCIIPDMAEGKIGKLWIVDGEEYENTVYAARIRIEMWYEYKQDSMNVYPETATYTIAEPMAQTVSNTYTFTIVPTAESSRTTQWLIEHGVVLNTVGEQEMATGVNMYWDK